MKLRRVRRWAVGLFLLALFLPLISCLLWSALAWLLWSPITAAAAAGLVAGLCAPLVLRRRWPLRAARRALFSHGAHQRYEPRGGR